MLIFNSFTDTTANYVMATLNGNTQSPGLIQLENLRHTDDLFFVTVS
jgi:hypothetical protein